MTEERNKKALPNIFRPLFDTGKFAATTAAVVIGILGLFNECTKRPLNSDNDFRTLHGQLKTYSFIDGARGRRNYYFYTKDYNNAFQIKANFLFDFDKDYFITHATDLPQIQFRIAKESTKNLNHRKTILIYSLDVNEQNVLSLSDTLKAENSKLGVYASIGFITFGILFYFYRRYTLR